MTRAQLQRNGIEMVLSPGQLSLFWNIGARAARLAAGVTINTSIEYSKSILRPFKPCVFCLMEFYLAHS